MNYEIEQETLSSGAMCFMKNHVEPNDLNLIWNHSFKYIMNDGSRKIWKTNSTNNLNVGNSGPQDKKKPKTIWTESLEDLFFKAIHHFGVQKATPKKIVEFMNVKDITRSHVASKLQKYRLFSKKVNEEGIRQMSRRTTNSNFTSSSHINPPYSYNYNTSPRNNNLSISQCGYGPGQSSLMVSKKVGLCDSIPYMNRRPTYDLSHTESNLLPIEFSDGVLPLTEEERRSIFGTSSESQAPRFGQYGTTSDGLGMNFNISTAIVGSNYTGIMTSENGNLLGSGGVRVNGNDDGSLGGIKVHGPNNVNDSGNGSLGGIRVHATDIENGNGSFGGIRAFGNGSFSGIRAFGNGSSGGISVHDTDHNGYGIDSLGGIRIPDSGSGSSNSNVNDSLGGTRLRGSGNADGSLGENVVGKNWNFNNNISNHGSSTSRFLFASLPFLDGGDWSHNNFIAQIDDVVPVQEKSTIFNDHHGPNEFFSNTINSPFDQNQHQDKVTSENLGVPTDHDLLDNSSFNNGDCTEKQLNSNAAYSEMYFPLQDMNIRNHVECNEESLNSMAVNPEIYFPPQDINITNQGECNEESLNSMAVNPEIYFPPLDINITNQGYYSEEILNDINAASSYTKFPSWDMNITNQGNYDKEPLIADTSEMYFSPPDMNIANQDRGVADLTEPPLSFHQDSFAEGAMDNYLLDHVINSKSYPNFA